MNRVVAVLTSPPFGRRGACRDHLVVYGDAGNASVGGYARTAPAVNVTSNEPLYVVLTDCPAAIDNGGVAFTGLGAGFCGANRSEMLWGKYLSL